MARHRRPRRFSAANATRNHIRPRPLRIELLEDRRVLSLLTPELEPNNTLQTATALPLTESPSDSGYFVGRGAGEIDPADDQDWWSFEASVGDLISVAVDTPGSSLDPLVTLCTAAGSGLRGDESSGPGNDAFISRYAIPVSGTYHARVGRASGTAWGGYELRVDVARGIDLETDAGYANNTIAEANSLVLTQSAPGSLTATVAGTIMSSEEFTEDWDTFSLGTLSAGNVVELDVRLPVDSTLQPKVSLVDADGVPVIDEEPAEGSFRGTIIAGGSYFAKLEAITGAGSRGQYLLDVVLRDQVPPTVVAADPLPEEGGVISTPVDLLTVRLNNDFAPSVYTDPARHFDLREAGPDGLFDTVDDARYPLLLDPVHTPGTNLSLLIALGPLPDGHYRFTARASLTDRAGNRLDGNGDGVAGDAYQRTFSVVISTEYTLESSGNDTLAAATALILAEDPAGSGSLVGRGLGTIRPSGDQDWWSFEVFAGDLISVAVDTPDSQLRPQASLYDAAGSLLRWDAWSGPSDDAFISRFEIPSNGTYYLRLDASGGWSLGSYELRVDVARGIELESDADYWNNAIGGANFLTLRRDVRGHLLATVAGTIMAPQWSLYDPDVDMFLLGTLSAGNVVQLDVRLPSASTLQPKVSLVDADGVPVVDEDPSEGRFQGTVPAGERYYAKVEAISGDGRRGQYLLDMDLHDEVPPTVVAVDPLPEDGGTISALVDTLAIRFSNELALGVDPEGAANGFGLRDAGADGIFDTPDDVIHPLALDLPDTPGTVVQFFTRQGPLVSGHYRFTADGTVTDRAGNPLDGNGDGVGGDAYRRTFHVAISPGCILESGDNDTLETATPFLLTEDPDGSGYFVGRGLGRIRPLSDQDWWSFDALAGDLLSVAVGTPDSDLDVQASLYNSAESLLRPGTKSGPNVDALVSRYEIGSSGTYYVRVESTTWGLSLGSYEVRVDLAREIDLESDADYANNAISGANLLTLTRDARDHLLATVAGTVMGPEGPGDDPDLDIFLLGTLSAGNVVQLDVRLPSTSTLQPKVRLVDHQGATVGDEDPADGRFQGTITADGRYYALVEAIGGAGARAQYLLDVDLRDEVPPRVVAVEPLPADGGTTTAVIHPLLITFSDALDMAPLHANDRTVWQYDGRFYVVTDTAMTWAAAQSQAELRGGHLVTVRDAAQQQWLYETFRLSGPLWIGLNDEAVQDEWVWISGEPVDYTNWLEWWGGQPYSDDDFNYAYMDEDGQWNLATRTDMLRGVLELPGTDSDGDRIPDSLDAFPHDPWNYFDLREAGPDGLFDTVDDRVFLLKPDPAYTTGTTIRLLTYEGPLPSGHYRFTANGTLTDRVGNPLDGNGDGVGGDAYQRTFQVSLPEGYVFEGPGNSTYETATPLQLTEDPAGSGHWVGRGLGIAQKVGGEDWWGTDDEDWWSFEALAGDLVSVTASVHTPDSELHSSYLNIEFCGFSSASWGYEGFISRCEIPSDGTYHIQVSGNALSAYELRVDVARGIDLEYDADYANDTIRGANVLALTPDARGHLVTTVAGTIGPPLPAHFWYLPLVDRDLFSLGTLAAGTVVELNVRLPSTSDLQTLVSLVNGAGVAVADAASEGGLFVGTVPVDGVYYARVESGWSYNGNLYVPMDSMMEWSQAHAYAESLGGHLVTIGDAAENDWLQETLGEFGGFWIGLTDEAVEGTWGWTSGEEVTYTNWSESEPSGGTSYNWAAMGPDGRWFAVGSGPLGGWVEVEGAASEHEGAKPWGQYLLDVDVLDERPPKMTAVDPLPDNGATTALVLDYLTVRFDKNLAPTLYAADPVNYFDLREAGPDGLFDTANDVIYTFASDPAKRAPASIELFIQQGPLPEGHYRFTAHATLTDRRGEPLDGNGDGVGGDAYQRTFGVTHPAGFTLESSNNGTRQTATPLTLTDDPGGSGYFVGRGLGNIRPASDQDWWSFEALAGDFVSVAVDTQLVPRAEMYYTGGNGVAVGTGVSGGGLVAGEVPDRPLVPRAELYDTAGNLLRSNTWGGPGSDAFISRYEIPGNGTYYVRALRGSETTFGAYQMRVDVIRGIGLESDADFSNNTLDGANVVPMAIAGAGRAGTIAGTIMAPVGQVDVDYFNLGEVAPGESIIVSLRLPDSSRLARPVVEIRDSQGRPIAIAVNPIGTPALAAITQPGTYYAVVATMAGAGPQGQYLMDAAVWPTASLEFPDLIVGQISAPIHAASGETVGVSWTVKNQGAGSTYYGAWTDLVVLSANNRYGDADDIELARVRYQGVLEPGQHYAAHTDVHFPVGRVGTYRIFVVADADNRVYEYIFESNNTRQADSPISVSLTPYADLETSNVVAPNAVLWSEPVTITWTVTNRGMGTTGDGTPAGTVSEWLDQIVFSRNTTFGDADDRLVAEVPRTGELDAGDSYTGSWTGMLPDDLSGEYYVFVAADAVSSVYEHDNAYLNVGCADDPTWVRQVIVESGQLAGDTAWDGLVQVLGTVTIPVGRTLTIRPGTVVKFHTGGLDVYGKLKIPGTSEGKVILTSIKDDTTGGDTNRDGATTSPAAGNWTGLIVRDTGHAELENFEIRYATTAINADHLGARGDLVAGVIRDSSQYGIFVHRPYVELSATNLVVTDNGWAGVHAWGSENAFSRFVIRNSTIVGNGFGDGSRRGGVHAAGADITLENCIVAFNRDGLDQSTDWPGKVMIRNSLFYNPGGTEIIGGVDTTILQRHGNLVADPQFLNRAAGNYELAAFSPAIDTGRAIEALATDILGRPRFDDRGMENLGSGYPAYVDMGAFERQESSLPYADLALVGVSVSPLDVPAGETLVVTWTVENTGQRDLTGNWTDAIYLSSDAHLSTATDRLLVQIPRAEAFTVGASYTQTWTGPIPADLAGPLYVIVRTNSDTMFREASTVNNTRTFNQVVVAGAIPTLTFASPQTGHVNKGQWSYYRFDGKPGRSVLFQVDAAVSSGAVHLYLRRGAIPTVSNYDVAATAFNRGDQELRLLEPASGVYYVAVYGQSLGTAGTGFTLTAQPTNLAIREVWPRTVGSGGPVTVQIVGDHFSPGAQVTLVASYGMTVIEAREWFSDASTLYATFDLAAAGAAPGLYDVVVTQPGLALVTKEKGLDIRAGGVAELSTYLYVPSVARPGRNVQVVVEYGNRGMIDLPSPLLTLQSSEGVAWESLQSSALDSRWLEDVSLSFLAISSSGPAAVLRPGQFETVMITVRTPFVPAIVPFILYAFGTPGDAGLTEPIDWSGLGASLRPTDLPEDAWNPLLARLQAQIGTTWGDYLDVLRDNADHLAEIGQRVYDTNELFAFEFVQAVAMGSPPFMDAARDAYAPAPGLPLSFERYFLPEPLRRGRLGPLGRGWTHSYQITLYRRSDGSVAIHGPSAGFDRSFQPDGRGGYAVSGGAALTVLPGGEFLLTEPSGLKYLFRSDGRWARIEEPNGNRLMASYDAQHRLARVTHSGGDVLRFEYNAAGRLVTLIDHAGRATHYTYDATGEHLLSATGPDGQATTYAYLTGSGPLLDHHLSSITRPGGLQIQFSYDDLGRLAGHHVAAGQEAVSYAYSTAGKTLVSDALGNTAAFWLDSRGRTVMTEDPLGERFHYTYDATGKLAGVFGPSGLATQFSYDAAGGNLAAIRDPMGHETAFGYGGPFDKLTLVRDARGNAIRYAYDDRGNMTRITYEDGSHEDFQYDGAGNLLAWTNRRGATITYAYNARGQLTGKSDPDTPGVTDFLYTYDTVGRLTSATGPEGTTAYTYHPQTGRLIRIDYPAIGGKSIHLTFEYDAAGRRTKSTDQDGHVLNYLYAAGWLDRMTDAAGELVVDYQYDAASRLVRKTLGNGVYTTYDYDAASQLINLVNHQPDGTVLSRFDYTYDALGRRVAMDTHYGLWTYQYDDNGQLTRAVLVSTDPDIPDQDLTYVYDAVGNRIRTIINGEVTQYTTNNMNQYVEVGDRAYVFDADGNLINETRPEGTTTYTYNHENRLISVTRGVNVWQYTYDALGNRVTVDENGVLAGYVVDPFGFGNIVAQYDAAGNLVARYNHGYGLLSQIDSLGLARHYTFDALGSTSEMTGAAGVVQNAHAYRPFGETIHHITATANPFEFVGQWGVMADATGLKHMRARFYEPDIGRFFSHDPLGVNGGNLNLFTYCNNNSVSFIDPTGTVLVFLPALGMYVTLGGTTAIWVKITAWGLLGVLTLQIATVGSAGWDSWGNEHPNVGDQRSPSTKPWQPTIVPWPNRLVIVRPEDTPVLLLPDTWDSWKQWINGMPEGTLQATRTTSSGFPIDPEDKFGPAGYDAPDTEPGSEQRYIRPGKWMHYRIEQWNHPDATVPAQDVMMEDTLDANVFDLSTFAFTRIGFLQWDHALPAGQAVDFWVDCRPEMNLFVHVTATFDPDTGKIEWWLRSVDPITGDYPEDPMASVLPPFNPETGFEIAWFEFRVKLHDDLATGTVVANQAFGEFDFMGDRYNNPAPPHGPWINTIDAGPPTSWVEALPAVVNTPEFLVTWDGADDEGGSGIARYDIYVSTDGGPFARWRVGTIETSALFPGEPSRTYAFYTVATDNVGHRESVPATADTVTYVNIAPVVTNLTATPDPVVRSGSLTLTAVANDPDGLVERIEFYRDTNGTGLWDGGDELLGADGDGSDGWNWTDTTADWAVGEHTFFARVQDIDGAWSEPAGILVTIADSTSWQNPLNRFDVDANGIVAALDVLLVINKINRDGTGALPLRTADDQHRPYFDVNGDGCVTALDVLEVINFINLGGNVGGTSGGSGEAESDEGFLSTLESGCLATLGSARSFAFASTPTWPTLSGKQTDDRVHWSTTALDDLASRTIHNHPDGCHAPQAWAELILLRELDVTEPAERDLEDWESLLDELPVDCAGLDRYFARLGCSE